MSISIFSIGPLLLNPEGPVAPCDGLTGPGNRDLVWRNGATVRLDLAELREGCCAVAVRGRRSRPDQHSPHPTTNQTVPDDDVLNIG